ncbi:single-stranded-DNA-specific exonuclease RecJ [Telmatospirillum siberiense]|uniref:Single-stranded-DNA-specific exonuclease RecJ n=1 Tax=Telmatospirillum siberiense TaxID=382514 RepID=A0A2N3PRQ7_9PROT|nr:single-stranded-DNA-specific exonuclease RecJ [Telmatospirillum siberiense]PKU23086.1 single-stranded-DNA-specific exonuclease RecJ [Telmatospirillum siberiense]
MAGGKDEVVTIGEAFLGVERSLTGRRWQVSAVDERQALAMCQRLDLPEVVGRVLAARHIDLDQASSFLNPTLRELLPDPFHLLDMRKAADRLAEAVRGGETIGIFGDYDVDGATSSALLSRFFSAVGAGVRVHIPDRMTEGYGPNAPALLAMRAEGVRVVATVDCGITAFEALDKAGEAGLDVIVIDHHEAEASMPRAFAVVNPNRLDEDSPHGHLAAVGVAFLLAVAVHKTLRETGWFENGRRPPDLMQWLDIVALGTICDVVPLVGVNRALAAQGLKVMSRRTNPGIAALADVAGVGERLDAYHVGYILGPRVNAGGRVGQADLGVRLLTSDDPADATRLAQSLDSYNKDRQEIEAQVLLAAIEQVESSVPEGPLVVAYGEGWHPGVIGIIAGRLKERYNRPACVIAMDGAEGKGSGRSVPGLDLGSAIIAARQAGLLLKGGGHAMAAGFSVARDRLEDLRRFLAERLTAQMSGPIRPVLPLDGALDAGGATLDLVETLRRLGPFGSGNAEPRFAIIGARVVAPRVVGMGHVACQVTGRGGGRLKAIAFRAADSDLGHALLANDGTPLHLAGTLRIDNWQGNTNVQLFIEDAAPLMG